MSLSLNWSTINSRGSDEVPPRLIMQGGRRRAVERESRFQKQKSIQIQKTASFRLLLKMCLQKYSTLTYLHNKTEMRQSGWGSSPRLFWPSPLITSVCIHCKCPEDKYMITGQNCSRKQLRSSSTKAVTWLALWLSPAPLGYRRYGRQASAPITWTSFQLCQ